MKSSKIQLDQRGFITDDDLSDSRSMSDSELIEKMKSTKPKCRSVAVRILADRNVDCSEKFIDALSVESALYVKIELQKALINMGIKSIPGLINKLGRIGSNQHKKINNADIGKKTYPIARDIAARILCGIGPDALPYLKEIIENGNMEQKLEAIDAVGYITFHFGIYSCEQILIDLLQKEQTDSVVRWKVIRAMWGFKSNRIRKILENIIVNDNNFLIQNEAKRSLNVILERNDKKSGV
jgi:hypothetical protein